MTRPTRSTRRAVTLYALYVLLTTAFAVLVVQVGVHRIVTRAPVERAIEVGDREDRLPVRTITPKPSGTPSAARLSASPSASPSAAATKPPAATSRPARPPAATSRPPTASKPPSPKPPPPPPAPKSYTFFLKSGSSGNRASASTLPLSTSRPTRSTLPNYDTDRDDGPGLRIARGGSGPSESDPRKVQAWAYTTAAAIKLAGPVRLTLWYAQPDFKGQGKTTVTATLQSCGGGSCTTLGTASVLRSSWNGSWQGNTFALGSVNRTLAAGHTLRLTVVADRDVWLAYDTTGQPSALRIG